ncbi:MAG: hypothetical protein ACK4FB_08540 [Brevundimonas sp.]|uniref:hypothetical protein n=1 Tax=Brevundimonas sp. TaxID=1871086 RepID=UPI00391A5D45
MKWLITLAAAFSLGACAPEAQDQTEPSDPDAPSHDVTYKGRLFQLDGEHTQRSMIQITLSSVGGTARRYWIESTCADVGYFDPDRGGYYSGFAPDPRYPDSTYRSATHDEFCDLDDPARQRVLREYMFEGVSIVVDEESGRATLETPSGRTAQFVRVAEGLIM